MPRLPSNSLALQVISTRSLNSLALSAPDPEPPALLEKENSLSAVWKYFGFEAHAQAKAKRCYKATIIQTPRSLVTFALMGVS